MGVLATVTCVRNMKRKNLFCVLPACGVVKWLRKSPALTIGIVSIFVALNYTTSFASSVLHGTAGSFNFIHVIESNDSNMS